jgi:hypothetical protein
MASQPIIEDEEQDDDVLGLDDPIVEQDEDDKGEGEPGDEGEETVGFADDEPDAADKPDLPNHLRNEIKSRNKEIAELKRKLAGQAAPAEDPVVVGDRPKLSDPNIDYDDEKFEEELDAWDDRRRAAEKQEAARETASRAEKAEFEKVVERFSEQRTALKQPELQDRVQLVLDTISGPAQSAIAAHSSNAAQLFAAVGGSPARLEKLLKLEANPLALMFEAGKMEATLQTTRKAPRAPDPDTPVRGRVVAAGSADKQLAKLEAEAEKTGKRDKVIAFKRAQKEAAK